MSFELEKAIGCVYVCVCGGGGGGLVVGYKPIDISFSIKGMLPYMVLCPWLDKIYPLQAYLNMASLTGGQGPF